MRVLKLYLMEITIAILFVTLIVCFFKKSEKELGITQSVLYNENWTCNVGEEIREYQVLPKRIELIGKKEVILRKKLDNFISYETTEWSSWDAPEGISYETTEWSSWDAPEGIISGKAIAFYSSHQMISASIDGKKIYEKQVPKGTNSKTPGNSWNFIPLRQEYTGKILEITIKNAYDYSNNIKIPEFIYGFPSSFVVQQLKTKALSFLISISMLLVGLTLVGSWISFGKRMHFHEEIQWLGVFSIYFAIWSILETQIPILIFGRELLCNYITFISLKLMILPIIYFIQAVYQMKESKFWNTFVYLSLLDFAVCFVLQFFGIFDYFETIWFTHLLGASVVISALIIGGKRLLEKENKTFHPKRKIYRNISAICIVSGCIMIDVLNYYYRVYEDVATFSRIGCLIFILILTVQFLKDSMDLIEVGKQVEIILEEAEMDGLTMLKNRKTFEVDLHQISPKQYKKYGIVIFDLNNLKYMNDKYGHGMGDYYIIISSEIIREVFGKFGEIYRIGGDEFCLISNTITQQIFEERERQMCDWLASLKGVQIKEMMQIASGFAKFHWGIDRNLQDTISRADKQMYQRKKKLKE